MTTGDAAPRRDTPWRLVRDDITAGIADGRWPVGSAIPSYATLAGQHHVSVHTVRRAIKELREAGILRGEQGVSVFVERDPATTRSLEQRVAALEAEGVARDAELAEVRGLLAKHLKDHHEPASPEQITP